MAATKYTVDVACFFCFTPNRVEVGVSFYEVRAWYKCHSCSKKVSLHITQNVLDAEVDTQIGKEIDRRKSHD